MQYFMPLTGEELLKFGKANVVVPLPPNFIPIKEKRA
jgi:hypothetical protein